MVQMPGQAKAQVEVRPAIFDVKTNTVRATLKWTKQTTDPLAPHAYYYALDTHYFQRSELDRMDIEAFVKKSYMMFRMM